MKNGHPKIVFKNKIVFLGFGVIGQAVLPLLIKALHLNPAQIIILSKNKEGQAKAEKQGLSIEQVCVREDNYRQILGKHMQPGDFLLNLSVGVSSLDLINYCQNQQLLYLDASTEPWEGRYLDKNLEPSLRSNYALREEVLHLKNNKQSTAVITHGANPGLVSHFVKEALLQLAKDNHLAIETPKSRLQWAKLAKQLNIKAIHIAERDTQRTGRSKEPDEFVNTWSVEGLMLEASQPAELGWGTHERHWPQDACQHAFGNGCGIYLNRPGLGTKVQSWTPSYGPYNGFLITHAEALSIADFFSLYQNEQLEYRPTVHYVYYPCPDATLSLHELQGKETTLNPKLRFISDEIVDGMDELGVLLMGNEKGAYWYGSQLSIQEARKLAENNNATSLQVASGVLAAVLWAIENPEQGLVEPEDLDHEFILNIAKPYLGKMQGHYTHWNPLQEKNHLFIEQIDHNDPWQFVNMRIR